MVVRTLEGTNHAGVNRLHWNLRDEPNGAIRLLTSPTYADHITVGEEGRPAPGGNRISILMPPGVYTVRLTVDGATHEQPLTVLKDPHSAGTEQDIAAQLDFIRAVREDVVEAGEAVRRVEEIRVQLHTMARFSDDDEVTTAISALQEQLVDLQMDMVDLRLTGQGQDGVRFGATLLQKLGYLSNGPAGADFRPTDQQTEVQAILHTLLGEHVAALQALIDSDVAELNQLLRSRGLLIITDDGP